jgi:hypothetical protein
LQLAVDVIVLKLLPACFDGLPYALVTAMKQAVALLPIERIQK